MKSLRKIWDFLSDIFRVFFYLYQNVGAGLGFPACLALPAWWRLQECGGLQEGVWVAEGDLPTHSPAWPPPLFKCPPHCATLCYVVCFFPLTVNKKV